VTNSFRARLCPQIYQIGGSVFAPTGNDRFAVDEAIMRCANFCETPRQLEYHVRRFHNALVLREFEYNRSEAFRRYSTDKEKLERKREVAIAEAKERDRRTARAIAAGLSAASKSMEESQRRQEEQRRNSYDNTYDSPYSYDGDSYGSSLYGGREERDPVFVPSGGSTRKIGGTWFHSDGSTTRKIGGTYFHSNGNSTRRIGNTYVNYHAP
jgi:hypothetical protein